jgi:aminoglycoside phosphotransferase (APT) family kinase protein
MDEAALQAWLRAATGDRALTITGRARLSGGAIQQNIALDVMHRGAAEAWVLRTDSAATLAVSHGRTQEFALLRAAQTAGVTVAEPLFLCADAGVIGAPFFIMRRVAGIAAGHRVVKQFGGQPVLLRAIGAEMARIHSIRPPRRDLDFLSDPPPDAGRAMIAALRARIDAAGTPRPVLEWGLRAAERACPPPVPPVLAHLDFRTGNLMIAEGRVTAVLDWEFAGWGDPAADLGWFCARCWRFGQAAEAGGLGAREDLHAGYLAAGGRLPDAARIFWWELLAHLRWAVIAADQAARHLSGAERSLELALTGHLLPGLEMEILSMAERL